MPGYSSSDAAPAPAGTPRPWLGPALVAAVAGWAKNVLGTELQTCGTDPMTGKKIGLDGIEVSIGSVQNDLWLRKPDVQQKYLAAAKWKGGEPTGNDAWSTRNWMFASVVAQSPR